MPNIKEPVIMLEKLAIVKDDSQRLSFLSLFFQI